MRKSNVIVGTVMFLALVLAIFMSVALLSGTRIDQETPDSQTGYVDLSDFDFSEKLAYIPHTAFEYYRGALLSPGGFADAMAEPVVSDAEGRFDPGQFGTYRIGLSLSPGQTYGLSAYSAMYSQRLFINSVEYPCVGTPGDTAAATHPQTNHYTVYFTPQTDKTEIVIQFANFCHGDFGGIMPVYVGTQEMITARDAIAQQRVHLLAGCLFTAFLFFVGMFFFFRRRLAFLWFSIVCLMMGIRMLLVEEKALMLLITQMPWTTAIGLEYMTLVVLIFAFLLYIHSMFPGSLHRAALWGVGVLCGVYALLVLLTPPYVYTSYILGFQIGAALCGIYVVAALVYNVIRKKQNRHTEHTLIFTGAFVFIVLSILDIQMHRSSGRSLAIGLSGVGMMVFIFFNMIALTFQFSRTEAQLDEARRSEREAQETNQLLDKMSRLKTGFLANISHEMRTPLTVMASYAGLTAMQIRQNALDEKTLDNLSVIQREAKRLAGLVEQLKGVSLEKERQLALTDTDALTLLREAADFCEPICRKNGNHISVSAESIPLRVNTDSLFQTLINLIVNANRHTREGLIRLSAERADGVVTITVQDNGEGIAPERLPYLFERGMSGDGGTGLGLNICREIIEEHGGQITIESVPLKETCVRFTLPDTKEGDDKA